MHAVQTLWYSKVEWEYRTINEEVQTYTGYYLICKNGYLQWPNSFSPSAHADKNLMEGYFSANLESVQKDVECVFSIIKK